MLRNGVNEKMSRNYTIYAVDFDGTLCENKFPEIGSPNIKLINHLIELRRQGDKVILWTCRVGERLKNAVEWCKSYGLEFDAINENLSSQIEKWGGETRKVFADVYIDDKAADKTKYHIPYEVPCNINVYDVDKIIKELTYESSRWKESAEAYDDDMEKGVSIGLKKAIEIVKAGVVND